MSAIELNARPHKDYSLHLQETQHVLAQHEVLCTALETLF